MAKHYGPPTVVPAQPGFYVAEFMLGDPVAASEFSYDEIVAWVVTVCHETDDTGSAVRYVETIPVTVEGYSHSDAVHDKPIVKTPRGEFMRPSGTKYDGDHAEANALEDERKRYAAERKRAAARQ